MEEKNKPEKCCIYCRSTSDLTKDHIPPKAIFTGLHPSNDPITVPSCRNCNQRYGLDDEYFRTVLSFSSRVSETEMGRIHWQKTLRAFSRPKARRFATNIVDSIRKVQVSTPAGLYLGKVSVIKPDTLRICRFVERIAKGMFFWLRGNRMSTSTQHNVLLPDVPFHLSLLQEAGVKEIIEALKGAPTHERSGEHFQFKICEGTRTNDIAFAFSFLGQFTAFDICFSADSESKD